MNSLEQNMQRLQKMAELAALTSSGLNVMISELEGNDLRKVISNMLSTLLTKKMLSSSGKPWDDTRHSILTYNSSSTPYSCSFSSFKSLLRHIILSVPEGVTVYPNEHTVLQNDVPFKKTLIDFRSIGCLTRILDGNYDNIQKNIVRMYWIPSYHNVVHIFGETMEKILGDDDNYDSNIRESHATRFMFPGCGISSLRLTNHIPCFRQTEASYDGHAWDIDLTFSTVLAKSHEHNFIEKSMKHGTCQWGERKLDSAKFSIIFDADYGSDHRTEDEQEYFGTLTLEVPVIVIRNAQYVNNFASI